MTDVFLSYSSADRAAANAVQAALTARGYDVFWDQEVPAGQDWDDWIRARLQGAKLCVVLWSKTSIASPNVRHEAMIALDAKKLVPAIIEALKPADFPMGLYLVQSVQLGDWRNAGGPGMTRLVAEVAARLGARGARPAVTDLPRPEPQRAPNLTGVLAAVAVLAALGAGGWYFSTQGKSGDAAVATEATVRARPTDVPRTFAGRITGHWRWSDSMACAAGTLIAREGDNLIFTSPDSRFVHAIESDKIASTQTRVTEPEFALGEQYEFRGNYHDGSEEVGPGEFVSLSVKNITAGTNDEWTRCELTP